MPFEVGLFWRHLPVEKRKKSSGSKEGDENRETYDIKDVVTPADKEKFSAMLKIISVVHNVPDEDFTKGTVRYPVLELFRVCKLSIKTD